MVYIRHVCMPFSLILSTLEYRLFNRSAHSAGPGPDVFQIAQFLGPSCRGVSGPLFQNQNLSPEGIM